MDEKIAAVHRLVNAPRPLTVDEQTEILCGLLQLLEATDQAARGFMDRYHQTLAELRGYQQAYRGSLERLLTGADHPAFDEEDLTG